MHIDKVTRPTHTPALLLEPFSAVGPVATGMGGVIVTGYRVPGGSLDARAEWGGAAREVAASARRFSAHRRAHPAHPVAPAREFRKTA
jgi:hypothetical protein